jgi:ABC-type uncharacterized transport system involved in gliding motility auxiliary subunit
MAMSWLKTRQTKFGAYVALYVTVMLAIVGLVNWLANRYNKSWDSTTNKRYSLSDQTDKLVRGLKQDVNLTYWDRSSGFPQAKDVLGRYEALSPKLKVTYIDPVAKPQAARAAGVREAGLLRIDAGNGRTQDVRSLTEEEITGGIMRAIKGGERTVCFVSGNGEPRLDQSDTQGFSTLKMLIERETYKTRDINLQQKAEVPKDCTSVVLAGPRTDLVQPEVDALKTYVDGGGRLLVMLSAPIPGRNELPAEQDALLKLLEGWGVKVNRDLVLEQSAIGQIAGLGPEVPLITRYTQQTIVKDMTGTATGFPLSRSLDASGSAEKLFSTGEESFSVSDLKSRELRVDPAKAKKGPFTLAAAADVKSGSNHGRLVVVGSADWATNNFLRFNGNASMIMNMLNWLSSDEDLISIRPKEPQDRRINMTAAQMRLVMYMSLFFLPLVAVAVGISVWWKRR